MIFNRIIPTIFLLVFSTVTLVVADTKREIIRKTLKFSGSGPRELVVDNVNGSIEIVGYNGNDVQLVAKYTIKARSDRKMKRAQEEVTLDISDDDNTISLYVDGPFRRADGSINYKGWRHYGYEVTYDFEIKVPHKTDLFLKTINDGEITVTNVSGNYEVDNINGGIEMEKIDGSGHVYALNGSVRVTFTKNPQKDSYFGSLNGNVDVTFQPGFSADLHIKTFNGQAYSDFPFTYLPTILPKPVRKKNGKYVYKSNRGANVRIGKGGPKIELDGFNGNIYIYENKD